MYQYLERRLHSFDALQSFYLAEPTAPAVNTVADPEIAASDRRGVSDGARDAQTKQNLYTGQVDYRFAGQRLSYVGMYSDHELLAFAPQDAADRVRDFDYFQRTRTLQKSKAHELRFASEERLFGFLDYTVGAFNYETKSPSDVTNKTLIGRLNGTGIISPRVSDTAIQRGGFTKERSYFGNTTLHVGDSTELSAGLRRINFETRSTITVNGRVLADVPDEETPTIYNVSASHRFSDDFMVYANHGKSWREGPFAIGIFRPLTPRLQQFTDLDSETSKSYELGFKSTFFDRRLRANLTAFHQDFTNFIYRGPTVYYVNLNQAGATPSTFNFVANVDAKVDGAELDIGVTPFERFSIDATFSYAKGKMKDGVIACNDINGDGVPDRNPPAPTVAQIRASAGGEEVAACQVNDRLSFAPDWNLVLQSQYELPITAQLDGFVRGLLTYYPKNKQDPNNPYDNVDAYGLLNLYAGVRSNDGAWEVSLFAKNVTKTGETLSLGNGPLVTGYQELLPPTFTTTQGASLASPYMTARYTPQREFGLNVRYAFGSR
jgi:iron complex outermembrane receptor protein